MKFHVAVFILVVWLIQPVVALAASFYLQPSKTTAKIGETVSVGVIIDSGGTAINAGEGSVSYAADVLEYQSLSIAGSIFTFWANGPAGNSSGVNFGGGLATPGYDGSGGKILTINFKAKAKGVTTIDLTGNKILANDGSGTNVLSGSSGTTVTVGNGVGTKDPVKTPANAPVTALDTAGNKEKSETTISRQGAPPTVVSYTKLVGLLDPPRFQLKTKVSDTIIVYLNDQVVDRFKASDKVKEMAVNNNRMAVMAADTDPEVNLEYVYDQKTLLPDVHSFRFARLNADGTESELTPPLIVKTVTSTTKIGHRLFPTTAVIIILLALIVLLIVVIIVLITKLFRLSKHPGWGLAYKRLKKVFGRTEKEVEQEIDETITKASLTTETIETVKRDLKKKVRRTFEEKEKGKGPKRST